jgi:hypothetical protein
MPRQSLWLRLLPVSRYFKEFVEGILGKAPACLTPYVGSFVIAHGSQYHKADLAVQCKDRRVAGMYNTRRLSLWIVSS